jgi:hypothetical protein
LWKCQFSEFSPKRATKALTACSHARLIPRQYDAHVA